MSRLQHLSSEAEERYDRETVRQAATLASRLQQHQEETLSWAEVEALARELDIDPQCMRQALLLVEAQRRTSRPAATPKRGFDRRWAALTVGVALALALTPFLWVQRAATAPTAVSTPLPAPLTSGGGAVLRNGGFEEGALTGGVRSLSHWTVSGSETRPVREASEGGYALHLGRQGSVKQIFRTEPFRKYRISFRMRGVPGAVGTVHRARLLFGTGYTDLLCFTEPRGVGYPGWEPQSLEMQAVEPGTTLTLATHPEWGPGAVLIDDVRVERAD